MVKPVNFTLFTRAKACLWATGVGSSTICRHTPRGTPNDLQESRFNPRFCGFVAMNPTGDKAKSVPLRPSQSIELSSLLPPSFQFRELNGKTGSQLPPGSRSPGVTCCWVKGMGIQDDQEKANRVT